MTAQAYQQMLQAFAEPFQIPVPPGTQPDRYAVALMVAVHAAREVVRQAIAVLARAPQRMTR
jgi:hypothetical protein